jgi:hypothetical protein
LTQQRHTRLADSGVACGFKGLEHHGLSLDAGCERRTFKSNRAAAHI